MGEAELESQIRDYMMTLYSATYNGFMEVTKVPLDDLYIYTLSLGIPSYMQKTDIVGSFYSDQDFLDYIYEELKSRNYVRVYFYKVTRVEEHNNEK